MTPAELAVAVLAAARAAITERDLDVSALPATTSVERPRNPEHGDYASNIALQLGKKVGLNPRDLAAAVAKNLQETPGIASVEIAGPGFLNIRLAAGAVGELAGLILRAGRQYGRSETLAKEKINLEFVSANPTGPVHLGHTRWAAVGDALGRILSAAGADVTREHYINDAGVQMNRFGESVMAAAHNQPTPPDGYPGEYVQDVAKAVVAANPGILDRPESEQKDRFLSEGYKAMLKEMQDSLERFGVHFDVWFSEQTLHAGGAVEHALDELRKQGHVFEQDGAVWLRTTDFGDDKDRVLIRSNGEKTYFAADAAYYINKRERGFERCIYMLGADHHGYIGRLKAIAACAGDDPQRNIEVLIGQLVSLLRGGEPVRLSKRAGTLITLDELLDAVGVDAARYSLARSSTDSPLTLDIDVITRQKNDNPVFYVQYVGARISSIARNAADKGFERSEAYDAALLVHEKELDLLKALGDFPGVVATAAELREPHRVARYLEDLAGAYHRFYDNCHVLPKLGDEEFTETHRARLWLNDATRQVIVNGLDLLGVSAPESM
ncbi:arginine--tRNA ligase [Dactylosporangium vinaceum]|uniref:Arginine--tRNA ligase n=1 Tax=Dactylosporangium vinaceum TaxID=53362 RepID=A0ABV5M6L6_9ACTN|nr:arginine--tRNA ligase [Dactylosporangium vinaceum]UAB97890.1 arginine--tRNA ligase [Dactylosporangium vinaceum]